MNRSRWTNLLQTYGVIALSVHLAIFAVVLVSIASAASLGYHVESASETAGLWVSAWVTTKLTMPFRLAATLALTPLVAKGLQKLGWWSPPDATLGAEPETDTP